MRRGVITGARWVACALLLGGLVLPAAARTRSFNQSSAKTSKLPSAAQSAISAAIGRDQAAYHAAAVRKGFIIKSPQSSLQASFTRQGVRIEKGKASWGMELAAFGTSGKLQPVGPVNPRAKGNRVEYRRGALTEWYINGPAGLEQGFTIRQAPKGSGTGSIELALELRGNLTARVDAAKTGLVLSGDTGQAEFRYAGLAARDARGRELHAWLELQGRRLLVQVAAAGAKYPLVVDPYIQAAKLTASGGALRDALGSSVSVSADGSTVVAGAPQSFGFGPGKVYVFVKPPAGWADTSGFAAMLTASDGAQGDLLGACVSVSAEGSVVVAGAPYAKIGDNAEQGAVYIFVEPPGGWANASNPQPETAKLTASDGEENNLLGSSVSINADGSTVIAGARGSERGAYVFVEPSGGWANASNPQNQTAKLTTSDDASGGLQGYSVSVSADGSTVLVGAAGANVGVNTGQGAAYVFLKGGSWSTKTEDARLTASDGAANDALGSSVSVSADGSTVAAGASQPNSTGPGKVYVFVKPPSGWASTSSFAAELTASDGAAGYELGNSVSVTGAGSTVVAGAPLTFVDSNAFQGAAYVFAEPSGGWADASYPQLETSKLTASDGAEFNLLGFSTAMSADGSTVVAGAPQAFESGPGKVYVFSGAVPFSSSFDASKLKITLGPPSSFALSSSFVLGMGSNGIDPLTEPVTLIIGNLVLPIPAGAFHLQEKGDIVFSGVVGDFSVNAKFEYLGANQWVFKASGSSANALSITNPVTVTLTIGNDSGTVTETVPID